MQAAPSLSSASSLCRLSLVTAALLTAGRAEAAPPPSEADAGPSIELAPEHQGPEPGSANKPAIALGAGKATERELLRGMTERRFQSAAESASSTSIGGYGEIQVRGTTLGRDGERTWIADIPRLVVFVAHEFSESFRSYLEIEVEHSLSCSSCPGAVELEQAYIEWRALGDKLSARAGLILVPMGVINQWHEPPVFHGVVRPKVDTVVIPSTWRELGVGVFGQPHEAVRYELYAMTGLDPMGFSAGGFAQARQNGGLASANAWALAGRVEIEPLLGFVLGASGYASDAGSNAELFDRSGAELDLSVPVIGWEADARFRRAGIEWRFVYTEWRLPESLALMLTYNKAGARAFPDSVHPVPTLMRGVYIEAAYDVLRPFGLSQQLLPFARIEHYNTQAAVPEGYAPSPIYSAREYTFGASFRPIQPIVLKADYQLRNRKLGYDETQVNVGAGFMY